MTNQELMNTAKNYCDSSQAYLARYKNDIEYPILKDALRELPTAYNKWLIEILGAPMVGKAPMNPYVAAGIGNAVAGLGGAVIMGVDAQKKMNAYNDAVESFNKQLFSIKSAGERVAFLVDEIGRIVIRAPKEVFYDDQKIEGMILEEICNSKDQSISESVFKSDSKWKRFENGELDRALNCLLEKQYIKKDYKQYTFTDGFVIKRKLSDELQNENLERRQRIIDKITLLKNLIQKDAKRCKKQEIIAICKNTSDFSVPERELEDIISELVSDGWATITSDNRFNVCLKCPLPVIDLLDEYENPRLKWQGAEGEKRRSQYEKDIDAKKELILQLEQELEQAEDVFSSEFEKLMSSEYDDSESMAKMLENEKTINELEESKIGAHGLFKRKRIQDADERIKQLLDENENLKERIRREKYAFYDDRRKKKEELAKPKELIKNKIASVQNEICSLEEELDKAKKILH